MKISKSELIEMNACNEGLERFIKQTGGVETAVEVVSLIGGENTYGDLLWLAGKILAKSKIVRFACDCALLNIEKIKPYTDDYDLIVNFLNDPGDDAGYAARAARDADTAAGYAYTYAAYAAIYVTIHDNINSASRAAGYAARDAARAGSENEVNDLLRKLFQ